MSTLDAVQATQTVQPVHPETVSGESLFRSLSSAATPDGAEAHLRRYIVEHDLQPGDRLPSEGELSTTLGSSRMVVREGLRSLEALGLVESRVGSGWYVRTFSVVAATRIFAHSLAFHPRALLDVLAVRKSAEADVVAGLAGKLTGADLAPLDDLVARMRWRASRGQSYETEDGEFHRRIAAAGGNLVLLALVEVHWSMKSTMYRRGLDRPVKESLEQGAEVHASIVDALRSGDAAATSAVMRRHHTESEHRFSAWIAAQDEAQVGASAPYPGALAALLWPGPGPGLDRHEVPNLTE